MAKRRSAVELTGGGTPSAARQNQIDKAKGKKLHKKDIPLKRINAEVPEQLYYDYRDWCNENRVKMTPTTEALVRAHLKRKKFRDY
jgi:hypothetical protein